jgi:hypothetical protein
MSHPRGPWRSTIVYKHEKNRLYTENAWNGVLQSQSGDGENMQDMSVDFAWSSKPTNMHSLYYVYKSN